jgi:hypothetical protein
MGSLYGRDSCGYQRIRLESDRPIGPAQPTAGPGGNLGAWCHRVEVSPGQDDLGKHRWREASGRGRLADDEG